ncbi:MAG: dTDP-glucose 4,6-dehydratase [Gammaproteobacteria bacterium]|nr:dTDP-glucose 4,6-dehydratase [Gammaproteobacteria bacterium]
MDTLLVTGGAGFIGSNFVLDWIAKTGGTVVNLDKLTYAGNLNNLMSLKNDARHIFVHGDIAGRPLVRQLLAQHRPTAIVNFAAESHVDRSIHAPGEFIQANVVGVYALLEEARAYWHGLDSTAQNAFRFLHVSTDEVYGALGPNDPAFSEQTAYAPNSPYAASKAAADHLVRAYHHTYGLPTLTTNCSNNYGPYQYPEKLIPLMICNALQGKPLPVYGDGKQIRDWLYVGDHCAAIRTVLAKGKIGETYNIGGWSEKTNMEVIQVLCTLLDELVPGSAYRPHTSLIKHVTDRPGHDRRYAIDARKIERELGWRPEASFADGLRQTVQLYLDHQDWVGQVNNGAYREWMAQQYGKG